MNELSIRLDAGLLMNDCIVFLSYSCLVDSKNELRFVSALSELLRLLGVDT